MALAYLGRNNIHSSPWNTERDTLLVELWAQGYSASQIADRIMGVKVSRMAVIGRAHRLKLPPRAPRRAEQRKPYPQRGNGVPKPPPSPPRPRPPPPPPPGEPKMRKLTLLELKPTSCRFPIGDGPQWVFCGADANETYCPFHRRIAARTP